jgi:hypothetical protein
MKSPGWRMYMQDTHPPPQAKGVRHVTVTDPTA